MSAVISLKEFIGEMETLGEEMMVFLNRQTGEFVAVTDELQGLVEQEDEGEEIDAPEWEMELLPKVREVMDSDDWLMLPSKFDIHEYAIMEDFCRSVADEMLRADLLDAIRGSGAFGRFKSIAQRHGLIDDWYRFRDQAFEQIAIDWLKANEIPYKK